MKTLRILERDHRIIEGLAVCLERLVAQARAADSLAPDAAEVLHLFAAFADGRHQDKEEQVLFPELSRLAGEADRALLAGLARDHGTERFLLADMRLNLLGATYAEPLSLREFTRAAGDYLDLQRAHMQREESSVFPLIERLLDTERDASIAERLEEIEGGPGDPHGVEAEVAALCERLGAPLPPAA